MIFLSAQPDDTYFIWQLQVLTHNLRQLEVNKEDIHILVGYKQEVNPIWYQNLHTVHGIVHLIQDERLTTHYLPSIRPHLIKKFMMRNPQYLSEYIFYHDADILFGNLPLFEGMEDGRVHVSRTPYIDYSYIISKNSPSLIKDLVDVVGIDQETLLKNEANTGGAQYFFKGLGYSFWDKVERDCEKMFRGYFDKIEKYKDEFAASGIERSKHDFQIWTTDMWVVLWNIWLLGYEVYANPDLDFAWPSTDMKDWKTKYNIFHNSGVIAKDRLDYLYKQDFNKGFPYGQIGHLHPVTDLGNGIKVDLVQQVYIKAINDTADYLFSQ